MSFGEGDRVGQGYGGDQLREFLENLNSEDFEYKT